MTHLFFTVSSDTVSAIYKEERPANQASLFPMKLAGKNGRTVGIRMSSMHATSYSVNAFIAHGD